LGLVTAAVVGVIFNLVLFLGKDVVFPGGAVSVANLGWLSVAWITGSLFAILKFKVNVVYLIIASLLFGLGHHMLAGV
jgi:chromate transporter